MMVFRGSGRRSRVLISVLAGITIASATISDAVFADTDLAIGGTGVIAYANGDDVRLRTDPGYDSDVIDLFPEGSTVEVIDGPFEAADGSWWYYVAVGGSSGFMVSDYLASGGGLLASTSGTAWTIDSVNLRGGPSTADDVLTTLASGVEVTLTGNMSDGWLSVYVDGMDGWVYGAFITQDSGYSTRSSSSADSGTMYTNDSVNLRTGPGLDRDVITELPAGEEVWLSGSVENGFAEASTAYGDGWIYTDYLSGSAPASSGNDTPSAPEPEPEPVSSAGQQMADFAMQFLGQAYVWAGNQPGGFDCSGLTQYVAASILGIDITHSTELQIGYGSDVAWGAWQPGDLVFFANTYAPGITHVGIYIGDGNFIHAENPSTGVVITSLDESYYSSRYAGARRLG
jgi:cell wall-associated NlpC family hydrolase